MSEEPKRAGLLAVAFEMEHLDVAALLPEHHKIVSAAPDPEARCHLYIVEGPSMPIVGPTGVETVDLVVYQIGSDGEQPRVEAEWRHRPGVRWPVQVQPIDRVADRATPWPHDQAVTVSTPTGCEGGPIEQAFLSVKHPHDGV